jgi:hypothetical protein
MTPEALVNAWIDDAIEHLGAVCQRLPVTCRHGARTMPR